MKELLFLVVLLFCIVAPNFILCDQPPNQEQSENAFGFEYSDDAIHLIELKQEDQKTKFKAPSKGGLSNALESVESTAYKDFEDPTKVNAYEGRADFRKSVNDKAIPDWDLSFGLSSIK